MKLLLTDSATLKSENDLNLDCFSQFGTVEEYDCLSHTEVLQKVRDADIILCNKTVIDREVFENAKKLRYIGLFATGYNNIDTACADEFGVTVCNAGSYSTSAVAQQVFAYILNHYSKIGEYNSFVSKGGWQKSSNFSVLCYPTDELMGKTIGIIGYGSIAKRVEAIAKAFEMNVLVYTRTPKDNGFTNFVDLDYLLANSDIVTVHCPLNSQSNKLFNKTTFGKMRQGAYFINTARGGVVDEPAFLDALKGGQLSGAAVDVLTNEPMSKECVLLGAPNLIITPHTAWAPLNTRLRLLDIVQNNIKAFLNGKPQNVVNNPNI